MVLQCLLGSGFYGSRVQGFWCGAQVGVQLRFGGWKFRISGLASGFDEDLGLRFLAEVGRALFPLFFKRLRFFLVGAMCKNPVGLGSSSCSKRKDVLINPRIMPISISLSIFYIPFSIIGF